MHVLILAEVLLHVSTCIVCASSEGSSDIAQLCSLARAFDAGLFDMYQKFMSWLLYVLFLVVLAFQ